MDPAKAAARGDAIAFAFERTANPAGPPEDAEELPPGCVEIVSSFDSCHAEVAARETGWRKPQVACSVLVARR